MVPQENASAAQSALTPGTVILERYRIIEEISSKSIHSIYKVEQICSGNYYALETLADDVPGAEAIAQFEKNVAILTKLAHPNLPHLFDSGYLTDGKPFYITNLIEGRNLLKFQRQSGRLTLEQVLNIFVPISYAIDSAHSEGIIHGNLDPSLIVLTESSKDGSLHPLLIGLVVRNRITGNDHYFSPEKLSGERVDHRSDIYSLACVLYETLTGAPPFHSDTKSGLLFKHQTEPAQSLKEASMGIDFPLALEVAVAKALEKEPHNRYQNFVQFADDLQAVRHPEIARRGAVRANLGQTVSATGNLDPGNKISSNFLSNSSLFGSAEQPEGGFETSLAGNSQNFKLIAVAVITSLISIVATAFLITTFAHQTKTDAARLSTDVTDYIDNLASANSTYMTVVGSGRDQRRVFHFPRVSLGRFGYYDPQKFTWIDFNAEGEVTVPMRALTRFETEDRILTERPNTLRLFGPNDISHLSIRNTKSSLFQENGSAIIDSAMAYIARFVSLAQLSMPDLPVSDIGVRSLQDLPNLVGLDISNSMATSESVRRIKNFKMTTNLRISRVAGAQSLVPEIANNRNLRILGLAGCNLDDGDLQMLSKLQLHVLDVDGNSKITDKGIHELTKNSQLMELGLVGVDASPQTINDLSTLKNLRALRMSFRGWKKVDFEKLKSVLPSECILNPCKFAANGRDLRPLDIQTELL